jgi:hypothetical protein
MESVSYHQQWQDYRKRSYRFWAVFLTFIPGVALIGIPLSRLLGSDGVVFVVAMIWMAAFAITAVYKSYWSCPRCNKPFFQKWWYHNPLAGRCVHCGLPKWAESDERRK